MDYDQNVLPVKAIVARDPARDLAVLSVEGPPLQPMPLARTTASPGAEALIIHNPGYNFFVLTRGLVSRRSIERSRSCDGETLEIRADFAKESSGAPILNDSGSVIGVARSTQLLRMSKTCGSAQMVIHRVIPAEFLRALLRSGAGRVPDGDR